MAEKDLLTFVERAPRWTTSETIVKVFLLTDNRRLREALTRVLSRREDIRVVGSSSVTSEVLDRVADSQPDILLLDGINSTLPDFVMQVRQISCTRIVMIGMEPDKQLFLDLVRAGVAGYVLKDASAVDVVGAVRAVADRQAVCPPRMCVALFDYIVQHHSHGPSLRVKMSLGLSRREQQLVPLIARGLTNKEIAVQLQVSEQQGNSVSTLA